MGKDFFKQKVAIFFGYNGKKFFGLQKNKEVTTVEEVVERALFNSGLLSEENYGDLKKIGWSRASRTDKGVHAAANGINCKVNINEKFLSDGVFFDPDSLSKKAQGKDHIDKDKLIKQLNTALEQDNYHNDVRFLAIRRVTKKFDIKLSAKSRTYEYLIPAKVFTKLEASQEEYNQAKANGQEAEDAFLNPLLESYKQIKATDDTYNKEQLLPKIQKMAQKFLGTHNYHNFTRNGKPGDKSMQRYILNMKVEYLNNHDFEGPFQKVFNQPLQNKYFRITLHGQSFIYHQIRKMVGSIVQTIQTDISEDFIENAMCKNKVPVWLAPGEGLLLDQIDFGAYNVKKDMPESLIFSEQEMKETERLKNEIIYPSVLSAEEQSDLFSKWIIEAKLGANLGLKKDDEVEENEIKGNKKVVIEED